MRRSSGSVRQEAVVAELAFGRLLSRGAPPGESALANVVRWFIVAVLTACTSAATERGTARDTCGCGG